MVERELRRGSSPRQHHHFLVPFPAISTHSGVANTPKPTSLDYCRIIQTTIEEFSDWLKKRYMVIVGEKGGKRMLVFPALKRFDRSYVRKVKVKMFRSVKDWNLDGAKWVHIVLTIRKPDNPDTWLLAYDVFKREWNRLLTNLRKIHLKKYGVYFECFFAILEPHKSGFPHLHIVINTPYYLISQKELQKLWKVGKVVWIRRVKNSDDVLYLLKYLTKQFKVDKWDRKDWVYFSLLWKSGTRSYSVSRFFYRLWFRGRFFYDKEFELLSVVEADKLKRVLKFWMELGYSFGNLDEWLDRPP